MAHLILEWHAIGLMEELSGLDESTDCHAIPDSYSEATR